MKFLDKLLKRHLIGLDIGASGIKAVELQGKKVPRLVAYNRVPLPWGAISSDGIIQDREAIVLALQSLFSVTPFTTKRVALGASGNSVITKKITLPKMTRTELNHQLYWEAEQYIPFDINEVNLDYAVLGNNFDKEKDSPMMDILLVAAKKDYIESLLSIIEEAGLVPEVVDIQAFALGNVYEFNYGHEVGHEENGANVIVDFGASSTKVSVVEGDKTSFARDIRQCGSGCTQYLSERLEVNIEKAEEVKISDNKDENAQGAIKEYVAKMVDEISRTLDFYLSQSPNRSIQAVYICGGASKTRGLEARLKEKMPASVRTLNPIQSVAGSGHKMNAKAIQELSYLGAVAIGLSLRTIGDAA